MPMGSGSIRACLVIDFENCFFVLKNKVNKENTDNTFDSLFLF